MQWVRSFTCRICLIITASILQQLTMRCRLPSDQARRLDGKIKQISEFALRFITLVMRVLCKELLLKLTRNAEKENISLWKVFFSSKNMINFVPQQRSSVAKRIYSRKKIFVDFFPFLLVFRELTVKAERDLMKPFVMIMIGDIMTRYGSLPKVTLPKIQLNCFNWMMITSA